MISLGLAFVKLSQGQVRIFSLILFCLNHFFVVHTQAGTRFRRKGSHSTSPSVFGTMGIQMWVCKELFWGETGHYIDLKPFKPINGPWAPFCRHRGHVGIGMWTGKRCLVRCWLYSHPLLEWHNIIFFPYLGVFHCAFSVETCKSSWRFREKQKCV